MEQIRGTLLIQWSRKERGPKRGEVTLVAIADPTAAERVEYGYEADKHQRMIESVMNVRHIMKRGSPKQIRLLNDKLALICKEIEGGVATAA